MQDSRDDPVHRRAQIRERQARERQTGERQARERQARERLARERQARERLARSLLYVCTDIRRDRGDLAEFAAAAFAGGVDILQIREKGLQAEEELTALEVVATEAERAGALIAVNDRADLARVAGAPVLHLGQQDLTPEQGGLVAPHAVIGRSTHSTEQLAAADADPQVDYFCVGPVWATPTKPGRAAVGLDLVRAAAATGTDKPWFAIGGIDLDRLADVVDAGARRVVVVRAVTQADDPEAAAKAIRHRLG
ncbi:MAG: thiamine phosphate synthase [Actinomycetales bacterium]